MPSKTSTATARTIARELGRSPDEPGTKRLARDLENTVNESKHTPGPWRESDGFVMGADGSYVCDPHCKGGPEDHAERDANAAVIAAAPAMYDALKLAKDRITELANAADSCWLDWPGAYEIDAALSLAQGGEG